MAKNDNNPCKVITGKCRLSYAHVWEPSSMDANSPEKYSVCIIIRKDDTDTIQKVKRAQEEAIKEGIKSKWAGKRPAKLKLPLRDGDEERPDDEAFKGCYFLNANSSRQPDVVDLARNPIMVKDEVYSGCYCRGRGRMENVTYDGEIHIAVFSSRMAKSGRKKTLYWSEFLDSIMTTTRTKESLRDYFKMKKDEQDGIKDVGAYIGGWMKDGRRKAANLVHRTLLTLDADFAKPDLLDAFDLLYGCAAHISIPWKSPVCGS